MALKDKELLRAVISRREPRLLKIVETLEKAPLTDEQREMLREVLADELCESGLRDDDEPNELGTRLDDLIGRLGDF
ncbi:MAG TPA: hypothetical protein VF789_29425 [Thermoanaerobaculia bacterium]